MASTHGLQKETTTDIVEPRPKCSLTAASGSSVTDQPDGARDEGEIYVQVTVLSKKLGARDDGTIILSPLSESLVS